MNPIKIQIKDNKTLKLTYVSSTTNMSYGCELSTNDNFMLLYFDKNMKLFAHDNVYDLKYNKNNDTYTLTIYNDKHTTKTHRLRCVLKQLENEETEQHKYEYEEQIKILNDRMELLENKLDEKNIIIRGLKNTIEEFTPQNNQETQEKNHKKSKKYKKTFYVNSSQGATNPQGTFTFGQPTNASQGATNPQGIFTFGQPNDALPINSANTQQESFTFGKK